MNNVTNPQTAVAAIGSGDVPPSGRKSETAEFNGSVSMDSEGKYDRILAGSTPGAAAEMIRKRLKGASSDPVTYQQDAAGFDFFMGGIPVARLQTYTDSSEGWHMTVHNVGRPFFGHVTEFFDEWYPSKYRRTIYAFAEHDSRQQNLFRTKAVGNSLKAAPNDHARFAQDLNDGAQIRSMLQRIFGGEGKRHVVQARFTVKYKFITLEDKKKIRVPDTMYTTFWVSDKKLFEYRADVEVRNEDGSAKKKTTLTQRIQANEDENAGRSTPNMAALAKFHAKNGKAFFSANALRKSGQLRADLYKVFPEFAPAGDDMRGPASPVKNVAEQFGRERAILALHSIYNDILGQDDTPHRRPRLAPKKYAIARATKEDRENRVRNMVHAQDDEARKDSRNMVVTLEEFKKLAGSVSVDDVRRLVKGDKTFESILTALETGDETDDQLYAAIYAVFNRYHINAPELPAASIGALVAPAFDGDAQYETFTNGTVTIKGRAAMEAMSGVFDDERYNYELAMEKWEKSNREYGALVSKIGEVKEVKRTHLLKSFKDGSEVGSGRRDKGYKGSFIIGGKTFVSKDSYLGRLVRQIRESATSRQIERAKKDKRSRQKNAVEAGRQDLADVERSEAKEKGGRRDERSSPRKGNAASEDSAAKITHEAVPDRLDVRKRSLGKDFDANDFYKVCMDEKGTPRSTLEKYAHKHVTLFAQKGWDHNDNPKIVLMLQAIEERGLTLPADYKPKSKKASKPRGQKKQHGNGGGRNGGSARPKRNGGYSRKNAPQTGSTSGLGNSS